MDIPHIPAENGYKTNPIPLRGKSFTHYLKKAVKPSKKHPLLIPRTFFPLKRNCGFSAHPTGA